MSILSRSSIASFLTLSSLLIILCSSSSHNCTLTEKMKWALTYGEVAEGESVLLISSTGFLELAVNKGSAARKYGLELGEQVILEKVKSPLIKR